MISREEIQNLAELSRIKLADAEIAGLQKDITAILGYVGQVSAVAKETKGESYSPLQNVMREDMPRTAGDILTDKREALLKALPAREGDYALVRKIIEK